VEALFTAVQHGNGTAAQFNHPDLGGLGQWMQGGMIMIGDFSNQRLKATVAELCTAIAAYLRAQPESVRTPAADLTFGSALAATRTTWWPAEFGTPTASGGQNSMHYAYFARAQRLAIRLGDRVKVYDPRDHQIDSVSQQQDRTQTLVFRSQHGEVAIATLKQVSEYSL
jgi:hypothetical protein